MSYQNLRRYLQKGRIVFNPLETPFLPEDPDWPTPTDINSVRDLMDRLSPRAAVLCALTAAEMVLPIWEEWSEGYDDVDVGAPRQAIKVAWAWISGDASVDEAYSAGGRASRAAALAAAVYAATAANAAAYAAFAPSHPSETAASVTSAIGAAAPAAQESGWWPSRAAFYRDWWDRCRARLAFKDVTTAEVGGGRTTGTREEYRQIQAALEPYEQRFEPTETPLLPEDPDWPTPTDRLSVSALMDRLLPRTATACAVIAAEMVFPIWEAAYPSDNLPGAAIRTTWLWLEGNTPTQELLIAAGIAYDSAAAAPYQSAAGYAAFAAIHAAASNYRSDNVSAAVEFAALAAGTSEDARLYFYHQWWSECRRRLAIYDVPSAEITWRGTTTGTIGTREQYERIHASLEEPYPQRFEPTETPLLPEDPDWPTPVDLSSTEVLMERLPHRAAVVCALTAAEMVLPIWKAHYPKDTRPWDAIRTTWRWLAGNASVSEVRDAMADANDAALDAQRIRDLDPRDAALAAHGAADTVYDASTYAFVAAYAIYVAAYAGHPRRRGADAEAAGQRFYRRWWSACRRRLAIYDVPSAEITWKERGEEDI